MTTHSTAPRSPHGATRHLTDYIRILHKRRWIALPAFLIVFVSGVVSSLSTMPVYEATAQLMIEKEARRATSITGVLDDQNAWMDDDFYPTQYKILQSRALALRTADSLQKTGIVEHIPAGRHFSLSPGAL